MNFLYKSCLLCILLLTLLTTSCQNPFNPESVDNSNNNSQYDFDSPDKVIQNLITSYQEQNLDLFQQCLSKSFRFELIYSEVSEIGVDMDGDGIKDSWWGYQQEVEYHKNLFEEGSSDGTMRSPDAISLQISNITEEFWHTDPEVGHEGWIIISSPFRLELSFYDINNTTIFEADGQVSFHLKQENQSWAIEIWRDQSNL